MNGEKKALMFVVMLAIVAVMVIYGLLFYVLWQYRVWVALSLLLVFFVLVGVFVRGRLVEQELRQVRYHHHEETPLPFELYGGLPYPPQGMQQYPYQDASSSMQQQQPLYPGREWE
jgi:uncharacterized protein (DUF58 family)